MEAHIDISPLGQAISLLQDVIGTGFSSPEDAAHSFLARLQGLTSRTGLEFGITIVGKGGAFYLDPGTIDSGSGGVWVFGVGVSDFAGEAHTHPDIQNLSGFEVGVIEKDEADFHESEADQFWRGASPIFWSQNGDFLEITNSSGAWQFLNLGHL